MKVFSKLLTILTLMIVAWLPSAAQANQCLSPGTWVDARDGFCFTFRIDSDGTNRLRLERSFYYPLWTDDSSFLIYSPEIYEDSYVSERKERTFRVHFDRFNNSASKIKGRLTYYVDDVEISRNNSFDLTKILGATPSSPYVKLNLVGDQFNDADDYCITSGSCGDIPSEPEYSTNAQYEFGVKTCTSMPCTINFAKSYSYTPLVFVMPTISSNNPDKDAPSRLYISSTLTSSSTSVTINQHSLPNLSSNFSSQAMQSISYFIIEPGIARIGGHDVVAGYANTAKYYAKSGGSTGRETVDFSSFGGGTYGSNPVILHQIQSNNNNGKWMTSGRYRESSNNNRSRRVQLFLELSASKSSGYNYKAEKIAFLATRSSGVLDVGNYFLQFNNNYTTPSQTGSDPMADGCDDKYASTSLNRIDGILLKKQERAGSHGGWLRRCNINGNKASVVVDEDYRDRTHINERVGYLAFEQKTTSFDICQYVPDGLQTNHYAGSPQRPWGAMQVTPGTQNRIYPNSNDPKYSFQSVTQLTDLCEHPNGNISACSFDANKTFNTLPMPTPNYSHGNSDLTCDSNRTCQLNSGYHKDIIIKENAKLRLTGGEYWLNELKFAEQNAQLEVLAPSIVHYKKIFFEKPNVKINQSGNSHDLLIIGHGEDSAAKIPDHGTDSNYQINVFFYVDPDADNESSGFVIEGDNNQIRGGITAHSIGISGRKNKIYPLSCDPQPEPEVASIVIKPFNYHLTCESSPSNIVEVHMLDSNGAPVAGLTPTLAQENGSNLNITYLSEANGVAKFRVTTNTASSIGNYDLKASLTTGGQTFTDTDQIKYVPYKFEVADKYLVAGKNEQVTVNVKACSNSGQLITLGYTGSPTATFNYQRPTSAAVVSGDLSFTANLTNSNRQGDINFKESGQIRVTITDNSFVCNDVRCPVEGGALKGQFDVYSRPWKIAICDVKETGGSNKANPATTTGSPGFVPGGTGFSATYKPIVHSDSNGGVSDECNYPLTGNYSLDNGPLNLAYSVSYPSTNPQIGTVTPSVIPNFSSGSETQTINHSWSEVGTLSLQTSASYLTMSVDPDTQNVGRFYPKYFQVINTPIWNYPGVGASEQNFAYMNQPFNGVEFYVEALNLQGNSVQNYGNFIPSNTAGFALYEANPTYTSRFHSGTPSKAWAVSSSKSIGTFKLEENSPSTTCANELCWAKATPANGYEDGPFNTSGGTASTISIDAVSGNVNADPIDYQSSGQPRLLTSQPIIYFGRAVIDSIGGVTSSTMNIPLRIEFWHGSGFVTHSGDDTTNIAGVNVVSDNRTIWVDNGATAANVNLAAGGVVTDGASNTITVSQSAAVRQQTQVWLDLHRGSNIAPWLRYRWQDANRTEVNGEEDPSTVVTFGIFRGNDRVIFRGESGLTGQ